MNEYLKECKACENDYEKFHLYIYGWFLPWLETERKAGKLKYCKCEKSNCLFYTATAQITCLQEQLVYSGEVDKNNKPCGYGSATDNKIFDFKGTWLNGVRHGISK